MINARITNVDGVAANHRVTAIAETAEITGPDGNEPADRVTIGRGCYIEPGVSIRGRNILIGDAVRIEANVRIEGFNGTLTNLRIGDGTFIGRDSHLRCDNLFIGDYTALHNHAFVNGPSMHIGHNCWIGGNCVLDGLGGLLIGDNVGIGAHSQLWSHIKFGDQLAGCRFNSVSPLVIEEDVWFVGHCIVTPIRAHRRSMAMVGAVVTHNMEENHVYAGVPAKDVTAVFGPQFETPSIGVRHARFAEYCREFVRLHPQFDGRTLLGVNSWSDLKMDVTQFNLVDRTYLKHSTEEEQAFMSWLTPTRAKFVPRGWHCPSRTRGK